MDKIITLLNSYVWSWPLVGLCLLAALYFSFGTRFVQVRHIGNMVRLLFKKDRNKKEGISSFQAFALALSGRVGTGNIVGVAMAIGMGGPGAIVWMWIIAFFGAKINHLPHFLRPKLGLKQHFLRPEIAILPFLA